MARASRLDCELAAQRGFAFWVKVGRCLEGMLSIKRRDVAQGAMVFRSSSGDLGSAGQTLHCSGFIVDFAEALASLGNPGEALTVIDDALDQSERDGVLWHVPELFRVKAEFVDPAIRRCIILGS